MRIITLVLLFSLITIHAVFAQSGEFRWSMLNPNIKPSDLSAETDHVPAELNDYYHWNKTEDVLELTVLNSTFGIYSEPLPYYVSEVNTLQNDIQLTLVRDPIKTVGKTPTSIAELDDVCPFPEGTIRFCSEGYDISGIVGTTTRGLAMYHFDDRGMTVLDGKGHITSAIAIVNSYRLEEQYGLSGVDFDEDLLPVTNRGASLYSITCHELGHTLGLGHNDDNKNNADTGTCMDYGRDFFTNLFFDNTDHQTLAALYEHTHGDSQGITCDAYAPATSQRGEVEMTLYLDQDHENGTRFHLTENTVVDGSAIQSFYWYTPDGVYIHSEGEVQGLFAAHDFTDDIQRAYPELFSDTGEGLSALPEDTSAMTPEQYEDALSIDGGEATCTAWEIDESVLEPDQNVQYQNIADIYDFDTTGSDSNGGMSYEELLRARGASDEDIERIRESLPEGYEMQMNINLDTIQQDPTARSAVEATLKELEVR